MYSNRDLHGALRPKPSYEMDMEIPGQADDPALKIVKGQVSIPNPLKSINYPSIRIEHNMLDAPDPVKTEGPYKHTYPRKFKEMVVQFAESNGIRLTCRKFNVTRKNVERWCKNGLDRKKGAGRKTTNPAMEVEILSWVEDYIRRERKLPKRNYIIIRAMEYADGAFKASKGWCDKFLKRNKAILEQYMVEAKAEESDESDEP